MTVFYFYFLFPWFPSLICLDLDCFVGFSEGAREVALRGVSFCRAEHGQPLPPTATCKQALTGMGLQENMGKLVLLQHFSGTVCCLPYKVFWGFVWRSNIIKKIQFFWASCSWYPSQNAADLPGKPRAEKCLKKKWGEVGSGKRRAMRAQHWSCQAQGPLEEVLLFRGVIQ